MVKEPKKNLAPRCFGDVNKVFPKSGNGLRNTPPACMPCVFKTECLRTALEKDPGNELKKEKIDRAYEAGMIGFLERWSRKKSLSKKDIRNEKPE